MADGWNPDWGWDGWWYNWSDDGWADAAWKDDKADDAWKEDKQSKAAAAEAPAVPAGPPPSAQVDLEKPQGAEIAGQPASASRPWPCNPGTSKFTQWLSDEEFQSVFHHPRGEPEKKPAGKKHDFAQLQRVCNHRVQLAEQAKAELQKELHTEKEAKAELAKELETQKLAAGIEIAELWTQKTDAESRASSAEAKLRSSEALQMQLVFLLDMKNSLVNDVSTLNGIAQQNLATLAEENMALGFQLEVLDDEIEGFEEKCSDLQKLVDELTETKSELMHRVGSLQTREADLQEKLNKYKQGLRRYRECLEKATIETKLFEDWALPSCLASSVLALVLV
eukprot:s9421_g2.t1